MRTYKRPQQIHYNIRFASKDEPGLYNMWEGEATCFEDAFRRCKSIIKGDDDIAFIQSVAVNGVRLSKADIQDLNRIWFTSSVDECDGGGGDAGGAASGDAGGAVDAGDIAGEMAGGTSTSDVLGKYEPGKGFMGDNFYIPSRVAFPLHRWELANGGSKRKKGKNGKPKKTPYEKGMKVVVSMFEDERKKLDKSKVISKLKAMSKGVKTMDDVEAVAAKADKDYDKTCKKLSKPSYSKIKEMFTDFYEFIRDICKGDYKASWFATTMVAVGLLYVISPVDIIPDVLPVVGVIDDAFVMKLVYDAVKDEMDKWRASRS